MNDLIRVLIIEDSEDDKELLLRELRQGGYNPEYLLVETREALNSALDKQSWDIVLSDYVMPNFDGLSALNIVKERELDIPFIIISGTIGEDVAVMAMKAGATDYIMKSSLKRLVPAVRRELKEFENRRLRNQAEKLLRENELKFRTLADFTYDMEYWEDENRQIIYMSPSCERLTGYKYDEFIANPKLLELIIHPDDLSSVIKHHNIIYSYKNKDDLSELEFRIIRKDKSVIYIYHTCRPIYNEDKKYLGRRVSNRDITDRHYAQESLKQSELKYKRLFNDDLTGNFVISLDGKIELCNPAMAKIFGFDSVDELMKSNISEFYKNKEDREKLLDLIREKKKVERYEQEHITHDGRVISLIKNVIGEFDENGVLIRLKGYLFDDTERKHAEDELQKKEIRYRTLFNVSPSGIVLADLDGIIIDLNESFCKSVLYTRDELIGKNIRILIPKQNHTEVEENIKEILSGNIVEHVVINIKKDGTLCDMELRESLVSLPDGRKGILTAANDITERKRAAEEFIMLADALKSVDECVSITDLEDNVIFVNQSFLKTYGYSEDEMIGKNISIFRSTNNPPELIKEILPSTLNYGWQGELWNKRKDGSEFLISLTTRTIKNKEKITIGLIGVARDITEANVQKRN